MLQALHELSLDGAVAYHEGRFPPKALDYGRLVPGLVRTADAVARYDQMLKAMHNSEILLAPLRNQEAITSSRMEGTVSTMDEILRYEADYDEADPGAEYARRDVIETFLYQRALKRAQKAMQDGQPLSPYLIRTAHQMLLSFGRGADKSPGEYKTEQNYLADRASKRILFVPIAPERLQEGMDRLFAYIASSPDTPLLKAAIAHLEFEALHPFKDGNGRIGRMLVTLLMWSSQVISAPHFYLSGYLEEHKDRYIDTMRAVSASDDWTAWCEFFLEAMEQQAIRNLQVAESIRGLYEEMKPVFSDTLSSRWSTVAQDFVFTNPVFRNNRFTAGSGIPASSAARFSKILLERGLLKVVVEAAGRRPAMYAFEPLITLVRI